MPEIYVVSNVIESGVAIGSLGYGEAVWHTDMSYLHAPPKASMLYALEIPPTGGDTSFVDMYSAFDALPESLRQRALEACASSMMGLTTAAAISGRRSAAPTGDPRRAPGTMHPLVCTHPESGRRMLYLFGRRKMARLEGFRSRGFPTRYSMRSGRSRHQDRTGSFGHTSGASAMWFCGTIAAPCIGAIRSTRRRGGSCIGPR